MNPTTGTQRRGAEAQRRRETDDGHPDRRGHRLDFHRPNRDLTERRCSVTRRQARPKWNRDETGAFTGAAWFGNHDARGEKISGGFEPDRTAVAILTTARCTRSLFVSYVFFRGKKTNGRKRTQRTQQPRLGDDAITVTRPSRRTVM